MLQLDLINLFIVLVWTEFLFLIWYGGVISVILPNFYKVMRSRVFLEYEIFIKIIKGLNYFYNVYYFAKEVNIDLIKMNLGYLCYSFMDIIIVNFLILDRVSSRFIIVLIIYLIGIIVLVCINKVNIEEIIKCDLVKKDKEIRSKKNYYTTKEESEFETKNLEKEEKRNDEENDDLGNSEYFESEEYQEKEKEIIKWDKERGSSVWLMSNEIKFNFLKENIENYIKYEFSKNMTSVRLELKRQLELYIKMKEKFLKKADLEDGDIMDKFFIEYEDENEFLYNWYGYDNNLNYSELLTQFLNEERILNDLYYNLFKNSKKGLIYPEEKKIYEVIGISEDELKKLRKMSIKFESNKLLTIEDRKLLEMYHVEFLKYCEERDLCQKQLGLNKQKNKLIIEIENLKIEYKKKINQNRNVKIKQLEEQILELKINDIYCRIQKIENKIENLIINFKTTDLIIEGRNYNEWKKDIINMEWVDFKEKYDKIRYKYELYYDLDMDERRLERIDYRYREQKEIRRHILYEKIWDKIIYDKGFFENNKDYILSFFESHWVFGSKSLEDNDSEFERRRELVKWWDKYDMCSESHHRGISFLESRDRDKDHADLDFLYGIDILNKILKDSGEDFVDDFDEDYEDDSKIESKYILENKGKKSYYVDLRKLKKIKRL